MKTYSIITIPLTHTEETGYTLYNPYTQQEEPDTRAVFSRWGYKVQEHVPAQMKTRIAGFFKRRVEEYEYCEAYTNTLKTIFSKIEDAAEYIKILKEEDGE